MAKVLFLSAAQIAGLVAPRDLIDAERAALTLLSQGAAAAPGRSAVHSPGGMIESMPGYLPGMGYGAKLVSFSPANPARGLPLHSALITLFDPGTGLPVAVLSAGPLTALRTAAVSAVAADVLARRDARVLALIGSGAQAAAHLDCLLQVRDFTEVRIASRNEVTAQALVSRYPHASLADGPERAASGADVICCCTSSPDPVLESGWVAAGTHLSSVGMGREIGPVLVSRASVFAENRAAVSAPYPSGALEVTGLPPEAVTEIGEVLSGSRPGRQSAAEVTLFKSVGHAVEDLAAGNLAYAAARERGIGRLLPL